MNRPRPPRGVGPACDSGAEDARSPNAGASSQAQGSREASGVRPIYRRFRSGVDAAEVHGPKARPVWDWRLPMNRTPHLGPFPIRWGDAVPLVRPSPERR